MNTTITITADTTVAQLIEAGIFKSISDAQKQVNSAHQGSVDKEELEIDFAMDVFGFMCESPNAVAQDWKTGKVLKKWYPNGYSNLRKAEQAGNREAKEQMKEVRKIHSAISKNWKVLMELGLVTSHCDGGNTAHTYYRIVKSKMDELLNPTVEEPVIDQGLINDEPEIEDADIDNLFE